MYVLIQDGKVRKYPYSISLLKQDNPGTSFPQNISDELLESYGVFKVVPTPVPPYNKKTESIVRNLEQLNGTWVETWSVELIDEESAATNIRGYRTKLLKESDWTQLVDSPLNADTKLAWALYRETLRMIPQQAGFPWNVTWPPQPQ